MNARLSPRDRPEMIAEARFATQRIGGVDPRLIKTRPAHFVYLLVLPPAAAYSVYWMFRFTGTEVRFWQLWLLFFAIGAALMLISFVDSGRRTPIETGHGLRERPKSPFAEANRWEDRMSWCDGDTERFNSIMRGRVVELIGERLRLRHGVDLSADPD
ncbi:MAG: hypothetical protein ACRD0P_18460, partial [Stackebrandtia sp.]